MTHSELVAEPGCGGSSGSQPGALTHSGASFGPFPTWQTAEVAPAQATSKLLAPPSLVIPSKGLRPSVQQLWGDWLRKKPPSPLRGWSPRVR